MTLFSVPAFAQQLKNGDEILQKSGIGNLQGYINMVDKDLQSYLSSLNVFGIIKSIAKGDIPITPSNVFNMIFKIIFKELALNMQLLGKLIILAVMTAVLHQMIDAFSNAEVGKLAHMVVFLALMTIAVASFTFSINAARDAVNNMVDFIKAILPILMTLIAAEGGVLTAGLLNPLIIFFLSATGIILQAVIFPLIYIYAALMLINRISPHFKVERLAALAKDGVMLTLGFSLTVFIGFLSLQGVAGAVADSLGIKTAKFVAGAFLPVVGGAVSDAVEVFAGTAAVMKNAVGIFGVIMLFLLCIYPAIQVLLTGLVYKLAAAIVEPIGDSAIGGALEDMGKSIFLAFGVVVTAGIVFFFTLVVIVGVGNINVMMR